MTIAANRFKPAASKPASTVGKTQPKTERSSKRGLKGKLHLIVPLLTALIGILLLLYPVVSTRIHNVAQQEAANKYTETVLGRDDKENQAILDSADRYNTRLSQGIILDPFLEDVAPDGADYRAYVAELGGDDVIGQIKIPTIGVNLPIYHGTFEDSLQRGAGHLFGTSLPVGGPDTHSVITAHTGLQNMTLFDHLDQVKIGDAFYIHEFGKVFKYVVNDIAVVVPTDTSLLRRIKDKDLVTLVTCTPYGINSHRLLVTGQRTFMDDRELRDVTKIEKVSAPWEWWMIALIVVAALAGTTIIGFILYNLIIAPKRRRKKEEEADPDANPTPTDPSSPWLPLQQDETP